LVYWVWSYYDLCNTSLTSDWQKQVYRLGRAATAVWIVEGTIHVARKHALQVIAAEEKIHIFWELQIQHFFMQNQVVMSWINRIYSCIHVLGSTAFLVWLFFLLHK
jgi:hypothetical protein